MKAHDLAAAAVVADQQASRGDTDRVPEARAGRSDVPGLRLGFERTAGDEIRGLAGEPAALIKAVLILTRRGGWRVGIGLGGVETPLPSSTRAARGPAHLAARAAVDVSRRAPGDLALVCAPELVGGASYRERHGYLAESALVLVRTVLASRSAPGWELVDLLDAGMSQVEAARELAISRSAVTQRLARAHRDEARRGLELAEHHLALAPGAEQ